MAGDLSKMFRTGNQQPESQILDWLTAAVLIEFSRHERKK